MAAAAAPLPTQALLLVFDADGTLVARAGDPSRTLHEITAHVREGRLSLDATRDIGARREQIQLTVFSPGRLVRFADGRMGAIHVLAVPDHERAARVDAFFGGLDQRLVWLTLAIGALGLGTTWLIARSAVRPLAHLRAAAAALGDGAFDRRVRIEGPREVAELASDFNRLAARLQDQHALRQAMTNDVAHELRTPLTAMRCRLESVRDGVTADPARACEALYDDVLHLTRLVDDVQDVALAEAGELRLTRSTVPLLATVGVAVQACRLEHAARLHVDVPADLTVDADATRIRQVLVNLIGNARRHAPADAHIAIRATAVGSEVHVEVENTGSHIPPDHLSRVFERFWRVDPARDRDTGGTGLGLAIVKHLVEAHGGRVWASSTDDTVTMGFALPYLRSGRMSPRTDS